MNQLLEQSANLNFTIDSTQRITALQLIDAEQSYLAMQSTNPPGNPFKTNNYYVFQTQQGAISIPPSGNALATAAANANGQTLINGTYGDAPYLIVYSLNAASTSGGVTTYPDVAATAYIPGAPVSPSQVSQIAYAQSSLGITSINGFLINFTFAFPPGFDPTHGAGTGGAGSAWIGLWKGHVPPYSRPADAANPVNSTQNSGSTGFFSSFPIATSGPYTAALYTSGWSTTPSTLPTNNIAAWIYFNTTGAVQSSS